MFQDNYKELLPNPKPSHRGAQTMEKELKMSDLFPNNWDATLKANGIGEENILVLKMVQGAYMLVSLLGDHEGPLRRTPLLSLTIPMITNGWKVASENPAGYHQAFTDLQREAAFLGMRNPNHSRLFAGIASAIMNLHEQESMPALAQLFEDLMVLNSEADPDQKEKGQYQCLADYAGIAYAQ